MRQYTRATPSSSALLWLKKARVAVFVSLALVANADADWCSGKKYKFFDMELAERVTEGARATAEELERVRTSSNRLLYDVNFSLNEHVKRLEGNDQELFARLLSLCRQENGADRPVEYGGVRLQDSSEVAAQIRLDIASLQSTKVVRHYLQTKKQEYLRLNRRLKQKANELAVLAKHFQQLLDPRGDSRSPSALDVTLRNACVAIDESEGLRMKYRRRTPDQLFEAAASENKTSSVSEATVQRFQRTCDLSLIGGQGAIEEPWYKFW